MDMNAAKTILERELPSFLSQYPMISNICISHKLNAEGHEDTTTPIGIIILIKSGVQLSNRQLEHMFSQTVGGLPIHLVQQS